ncbi:MAG: MOSC domain-containing protein, partial [Pseudomonadota bacterium]
MSTKLKDLLDQLPQVGRVRWIGLRPEKFAQMRVVDSVAVTQDHGLVGDRYGKARGKRQVTLIQYEHLQAMASLLHRQPIDPGLLRRNIVVAGINLWALKNRTFQIGTAKLECTGLCHPCSRMEKALGPGGYNAVRGHGGITAR